MVIMTRGSSAANARSVNVPAEQDSTLAGSVSEEGTNGDSVPPVSTTGDTEMESVGVTIAPPEENPTVTASVPEVAVDESVLGYLQLVGDLEKNVSRTDNQSIALSSSNVSVEHRRRAVEIENSFVQGLAGIGESCGSSKFIFHPLFSKYSHSSFFQFKIVTDDGKSKWASLLEDVPNPQYTGLDRQHSQTIPKAFLIVSGTLDPMKVKLCNFMLVDWQINLKKKRVKKSDPFEWYQPSTQSMQLRTFLAHMKSVHNWKFEASNFSKFEGCLNGVINTIFEQRREEFVSIFVLVLILFILFDSINSNLFFLFL
jgi:hypothetical protein